MRAHLFASALILAASSVFADSIPVPAEYVPPFYGEKDALKGLVITIDAGHGGSSFSPGYSGSARGINSPVVEGDLNMLVTALLYHHLNDAGAKVHMTRRDDRKVTPGPSGRSEELNPRPGLADETRSHLFLSLHHNSASRRTADGVMILIWPTDKAGEPQPLETAFADVLREEVEKGVHHKEPFKHYVVDHPLASASDIPSAVVEFGFLSNPEFDAWVSQPAAPKAEAKAAYNAIVRMWREKGSELEANRVRLFPDAATPKAEPTPIDPVFTQGAPNRSYWPFDRPAATTAELNHVVGAFRNSTMTDRTSFAFDVRVEQEAEEWILTGRSSMPQLTNGVLQELTRAAAAPIVNRVEELPSQRLANRFATVQIPMALTWSQPKEGVGVQTQVLLGEPLWLLDVTEDKGWYLVQGLDGYVGWLRTDAVAPLSQDEFTALLQLPLARVTLDAMVETFRVPAGAVAPFGVDGDSTVTLRRAVENPRDLDPLLLSVPRSSVLLPRTPHTGITVAETGLSLIYTPYVFGGRSSQGMDCSGFVGQGWAAAGMTLPRDANQQILVGALVGTAWHRDGVQPGDNLFFADERGRIIHTGISLGGDRFIHCSPPEVQITSFDEADPLYSATWTKAFVMARRPSW